MEELTQIQNFYSGRSIFLTGVSGFLGKALLEKLLRSCSQVSNIYVLLRPKRNVDVQSRLHAIFQSPIFDRLKSEKNNNCEWETKVHAVAGDITLPFLGINEEMRKEIIESVSVVIHSAASVKFNEDLKDAMNSNYYGTERVLHLCRELKHLVSFVHISTAYSNCDLDDIPEKIVNLTPFPEKYDQLSDEELKKITPILIGKKPNTYTYTKALTETLLEEQRGNLPICIVRPSIVCSAWQEPKPGYVDSLNALTGVLAAMGKGILTTIHCKAENSVFDTIPLDVTVNVVIAAGWHMSECGRSKEIPVYNVCSGSINPISCKEMKKCAVQSAIDTPAEDVFRYPTLILTSSLIYNRLLRFSMTFIPFLLIDVFSWIFGRKSNMVRLYNKLTTAVDSMDYFGTKSFPFSTGNLNQLKNKMGEKDKTLFYWNIEDLKWEHYMSNYYLGIKSYIFKEDPHLSMKTARQQMTRVYWGHKAISLFILFLVFTMVYSFVGSYLTII